MFKSVRAHLLLLGGTLVIGSVLYPLVLLVVGRVVFPYQAAGSLVHGADGAVGSVQIAQEFKGDEWFQPRPSAAGYNGAASSGSNWGANNPKLRDRVARQLGPVVKYAGSRAGQPVGPDVEKWFGERPDRVATWAKDYPTLAAAWVTSDELTKAFVNDWAKDHPEVLAGKAHDPDKPEDLAAAFFAGYAKAHPASVPQIVETKRTDGTVEKKVQPVKDGGDIQAIFFEMWLQAHPDAELEKVPADMVMASGSGLDPHITVRNARYQLDRVVAAQAVKAGIESSPVRRAIEAILGRRAFTPLAGLAGEPLVNVLEVNLALRDEMKSLAAK